MVFSFSSNDNDNTLKCRLVTSSFEKPPSLKEKNGMPLEIDSNIEEPQNGIEALLWKTQGVDKMNEPSDMVMAEYSGLERDSFRYPYMDFNQHIQSVWLSMGYPPFSEQSSNFLSRCVVNQTQGHLPFPIDANNNTPYLNTPIFPRFHYQPEQFPPFFPGMKSIFEPRPNFDMRQTNYPDNINSWIPSHFLTSPCGPQSITPQIMEQTQNEPSEVRPYVCPYTNCNKSYKKKSHLKTHVRSHTHEKPFECQWPGCSWKFARSDELTRHNRRHTHEKPYTCTICGRKFARSDHLNAHKKRHLS